MAVSRKISGSRNLVLFICIYIILCGIFNSKTRKTSRISIWEKLCVCVEVTNAINFFKAFKRRRTSKQRPLANRLKLIIGLRFILYTSYSVFLLMLSGDVEINPGPRCKEKDSVKCVTINARSLTSLVKFNDSNTEKSWMNKFESFLQDVCTRHSKIVIAGDCNLPCACRQLNENGFGGNEHAFVKILNDFFLEQMNTCPTRGENILDLVITSIPDRMKVSEVVKPSDTEISTDHSAI